MRINGVRIGFPYTLNIRILFTCAYDALYPERREPYNKKLDVICSMILTTAQQMKELDRATIEDLGIPGLVLMENAGRGVVQVIGKLYPKIRSAAVLAGKGNNGGDGFVIARYLHHQGVKVTVFLAGLKSVPERGCAPIMPDWRKPAAFRYGKSRRDLTRFVLRRTWRPRI